MEIRIETYTDVHSPAARAFNQRIASAAAFGLAPNAPKPEAEAAPIRNMHYVVVEGEAIRGGFLMAGFRGAFGDRQAIRVWNCREPLSEGITDAKYTFLAIRMLKHIQQQSAYVFALGMGGEQLPFPRLLRGAGWTVWPVPFLFRISSAGRFARELRLLQHGPKRILARIAAATGIAQAGAAVLQVKSLPARFAARGCTIERVDQWGEWADDVWAAFRGECSFSVVRDREGLAALYPLDGGRIQGYVIRRAGKVLGWAATMNTAMSQHKYFGNLRVGTILDCVAPPDGMKACIALTANTLTHEGADLVVTNQSHGDIVKAFRQAGFLSARSNYILALSKPFGEEIFNQPAGRDRMHFTRGDSDGRIHL